MARSGSLLILLGTAVLACKGDPVAPPPPPPPNPSCSGVNPTALVPGAHAVVDPANTGGCLKLPAAGAGGAEYLVVALSTAGQETPNGASEAYTLTGSATAPGTSAVEAAPSPMLGAFKPRLPAQAFHDWLRQRERSLAQSPAAQFSRAASARIGAAAAVPPMVGNQRNFWVCADTQCNTFTSVAATAKYVGAKGAIYLDDAVPAGGFTQADIDTLGLLFDGNSPNMYDIDTTAFGAESDLDTNDVAIILLTDAVNALSGNCNATGSVILGFFFGLDLFPGMANSNGGEIFYSFVPDPNNPSCTVSKSFVKSILPPTFIHEFQHMISFNQRVLLRSGQVEHTWLNEALAHFAEELGGRLIPDGPGLGSSPDRFSQFLTGNVTNAYGYLENPEATFLITPGNSTGTLDERGANWLFLRWIADHFDTDPNGGNLTRALVQTTREGSANVAAATGVAFATLIPEWQLANYLDNLSGFTGQSPRLSYESWNFRNTFASLNSQDPVTFPRVYPLVPLPSQNGSLNRTGTLRGGSGVHVLVTHDPSAAGFNFVLASGSGNALSAAIAARFAVVRIQ